MTSSLIDSLRTILLNASPILFAVMGETLTEKVGVINLSLNGLIILSGLVGFITTQATGSFILGFLAGALVGAFISLIIAFMSITLKQSQVAVGFVLAVMCKSMAYFLGKPFEYSKVLNSPPAVPIPGLASIPYVGPILFNNSLMVYLSILIIFVTYFWIYKTYPGLVLRGIGEKPISAFVRGDDVKKLRYLYVLVGGALAGLAGPVFTLGVKGGWYGQNTGVDGYGWIVLAIVIFGGWSPFRAAFGAYLFPFLQWLSIHLQGKIAIPKEALNVAPFGLMILTLAFINVGNAEWVENSLAKLPKDFRKVIAWILRALRTNPPASLGTPFENE
jgi:ABC-type uncharacterized transport system permease subunit